MSRLSDYHENGLLDHLVGNATFAVPTNWLALCAATVVDSDTGSTITETNYGSYARLAIPAARWQTASGSRITNVQALTFAAPTADATNGNVTDFAICDAASAGNMLIYGLCGNVDIDNGASPPIFQVNNLTTVLGLQCSTYFGNAWLNHIFNGITFTPPATLYMAMCPVTVQAGDTGSTITETDYTSYARLATTAANWNAASGGSMTNSATFTWATATGAATNGALTDWALLDAATGGNLLMFGKLTSALQIKNNEFPEIDPAELTLIAA